MSDDYHKELWTVRSYTTEGVKVLSRFKLPEDAQHYLQRLQDDGLVAEILAPRRVPA